MVDIQEITDYLKMWATDQSNYVIIKSNKVTIPDPAPILTIDQGLWGLKDIHSLGYLSTTSKTQLVFTSTYTDCQPSDIGKRIKVNGSRIDELVLAYYKNADKIWWLSGSTSTSASIPNGAQITIDGGVGAGTTSAAASVFGGGAIYIGHGLTGMNVVPQIILSDAEQGYNTLYLRVSAINETPAHLDLGNLTAHGNATLGSAGLTITDGTHPISIYHNSDVYQGTTQYFLEYTGNVVVDGFAQIGAGLSVTGNFGFTGTLTSGNIPWSSITGAPSGSWNGGTVTNNIIFNKANYLAWWDTSDSIMVMDYPAWRPSDLNVMTYGLYNGYYVWRNTAPTPYTIATLEYNGNLTIARDLYARIANVSRCDAEGNDAGFRFKDRTSGRLWEWYGISDSACLWNGIGNANVLWVDPLGNLTIKGGLKTDGAALTLAQDTVVSHIGTVFFNVHSADGEAVINLQRGSTPDTKGFLGTDGTSKVYLTAASGLNLEFNADGGVIDFNSPLKQTFNGLGYYSYYGGGGSVSGGVALDGYGNICFNGASVGNSWNIFKYNNSTTPLLTMYWNTGELTISGGLTTGGRVSVGNGNGVFPSGNGVGFLGGNGQGTAYYWGTIYTNYANFKHTPTVPFDNYDDLTLVKQWGEPQPTIPIDYDETKVKPPVTDPFAILRSVNLESGEIEDFYDIGKVMSFSFGCAKALAKKQDAYQSALLEMFNKVEAQQKEIDSLRSQLAKLSAKGGVSA